MWYKDRNKWPVLLIFLACLMFVAVFFCFGQFELLMNIILIYGGIWALLIGLPAIFAGIKELYIMRKQNQKFVWYENKLIIQGIAFILPYVFALLQHFGRSGYYPGRGGPLILDIVWITVMIIFMPIALFLQIGLTIGFINNLRKGNKPYAQYIQGLSADKQTSE